MKKLLTLLLLLALLLTGCAGDDIADVEVTPPAEQAQQEEKPDLTGEVAVAIDAIGAVTPESEAKIQLAEQLYDSLSREEKKQVTNAKKLVDARDEYDRMEKDINTVIDLIEAIGEVTSSKVNIMKQARKNYDALGDDLQKYVSNYEDLEEAESTYGKLMGQEAYNEFLAEFESQQALDALETAKAFMDTEYGPGFTDEVNELCCGAYVKLAKWYMNKGNYQTAVYYIDEGRSLYSETETVAQMDDVEISVVEAAISGIGTVTYDKEDKIKQAEELYARLDEVGKGKISNAKALTNARKTFDQLGKDIEAVVKLINDIGEVTTSKGDAISKARAAYNKLDEASQSHVSNLSKLTSAENTYYSLMAKEAYDDFLAEYESESASEAIKTATEFLNSKYGSSYYSKVNELRCKAYIRLIEWYIDNGYYESASYYISECESLCANTESVSKLSSLKSKVSAATAVEEPANGSILADTLGDGRNYLIIDNSSTKNSSYVEIQLRSDTRKYKKVYIRAGKSVTISLPDGEYSIVCTSGKVWYGESTLFGESGTRKLVTKTFEKTSYTLTN